MSIEDNQVKGLDKLWIPGIGLLVTGLIINFIGPSLAQCFLTEFFSDSFRIFYYIQRMGSCLICQGVIILCVAILNKYFSAKITSVNNVISAKFNFLPFTHPLWIFLSGAAISFYLYYPTINEFFFLGDFWLLWSSKVNTLRGVLNFFSFKGKLSYRPLQFSYFFIMQSLSGLNPQLYHISQILLHGFNASLLAVLLIRLTGNTPFALISAFLFISRVCHLETIFWAATIADLMAATFTLLSIIWHIKPQRTISQPVSVCFYVLALMCKEAAVVLPGLLLAYEVLVRSDLRNRWKSIIWNTLPHFTVLSIYMFLHLKYVAMFRATEGQYKVMIGKNILNNLLNYIRFSFNGPFDPLMAFILIYGIIIIFSNKTKLLEYNLGLYRWIMWGFSWFIISALPVLIISMVTCYYVYIPSIGICLAMGAILASVYNYNKSAGKWLIGFFLIASFSHTSIKLKQNYAVESNIAISRISRNYMEDIKRFYPTVPAGTHLYFIPYQQRITAEDYFATTHGGFLFKVFYPQTVVKFMQPEEVPRPIGSDAYVFGIDEQHLHDLTDTFRRT